MGIMKFNKKHNQKLLFSNNQAPNLQCLSERQFLPINIEQVGINYYTSPSLPLIQNMPQPQPQDEPNTENVTIGKAIHELKKTTNELRNQFLILKDEILTKNTHPQNLTYRKQYSQRYQPRHHQSPEPE